LGEKKGEKIWADECWLKSCCGQESGTFFGLLLPELAKSNQQCMGQVINKFDYDGRRLVGQLPITPCVPVGGEQKIRSH
jgi:hypothetical protein